jgi:hypothetical protein
MSSFDRDDPEAGAERRGSNVIDKAKAKTSLPGTLMILVGGFLLLWILLSVAIVVSGFDVSVAMLEWMANQMPKGSPEHKNMLAEIEKAKVRDKTIEYIQTAVIGIVNLISTFLIIIGGLRMKSLQSYTLCIIGSIMAIVPCSGCCIVSFPFGLWALIALMNADVKAGFTAAANGGNSRRSREPVDDLDDDRGRFRDRDDDNSR